MKKNFLSMMFLFGTATCITAQNATVESPFDGQSIPVTHWSASLKGGASFFRAGNANFTQLEKADLLIGGTLDYTINPLFGLGIEYLYSPYSNNHAATKAFNGDLKGSLNDAIVYGSLNLSNLLSPYRSAFWSKINIYGNAGVGLGFYNTSIQGAAEKSKNCSMVKYGLNLEYTLSNKWALGLEGQYRYYERSNLGSAKGSIGSGDALAATLGLRYKFASKTNKKHARNISMYEYVPKPAPAVVPLAVKCNCDEALNRIKELERQNNSLNQKQQKLEADLKALSALREVSVDPSFQNIEFETGSNILTKASCERLDNLVSVLNKYTWSELLVSGHTDNVGNDALNQNLSESRANAVKAYLAKKGIPEAKIKAVGYGETKPISSNDNLEGRSKNRRVEFVVNM
jgi:outer membrane protein OmpA-like peptidoglycan-associated protein